MAVNTLFDNINIRGLVDSWARYTIEAWRKELRKKKIGVTNELYQSFTHQLQRDSNELLGVLLKFKFYGRLRDMGVGKGVKAYEVKNNTANQTAARQYGANVKFVSRKPGKWFNKIKTHESHRLREILAEKAGFAISTSVADILNNSSEINIKINGQ
jgi:hypothetical protein